MQLSFFAPSLKLNFDFQSSAAALTGRALDGLAEIPVRRKVAALLFVLGILAPLALLIVLQAGGERPASSALVLYCVGMILLLAPGSALLSHVLALRSIRSLNLQSQRLKMGDFTLEDLPPERGEEHDFLRLKRNLHWMGYALKSREDKLASAVSSLAEAQSQIGESIDYASLIQRAFLPGAAELGAVLAAASQSTGQTDDGQTGGQPGLQAGGHFLINRQLGSVGGDACWCKAVSSGFWLAVVDCTGHGVPGAFMTLIVHSMFERAFQALNAAEENSPGALLGRVNRLIKEALGQTGDASLADDGMDCSLCLADLQAGTLTFAGARGALYVAQGAALQVLKGEARGAGYVRTRMDQTFADVHLPLAPGMRLYMTTDGLLDQVGGERGLPFGRKRFLEFLAAEADQPLARQGQALLPLLDAYRGRESQRDDITVLGFELGPRNKP